MIRNRVLLEARDGRTAEYEPRQAFSREEGVVVRVMEMRVLGKAAIRADLGQIEVRMPVLEGRLDASAEHMSVRDGVQVYDPLRERPVDLPSLGGGLEEIPIESHVVAGQSLVSYAAHPGQEILKELRFGAERGVADALFGEMIEVQSLLFDFGALEYAAFAVELVLGIAQIDRPYGKERVHAPVGARGLGVYDDHDLIVSYGLQVVEGA